MPQKHVCPWWAGYILASPLRRLFQKPESLVEQFLKPGMRILEIGPGMGYFTLSMARMVGSQGKIFAIDIQDRMIRGLCKRAVKAGLSSRIETRLATPETTGIDDLQGTIDFTLLMAVMHEVPDPKRLLSEIHAAMKLGGIVLMADPKSHCSREEFEQIKAQAQESGFVYEQEKMVRKSWSAVLVKR